MGKMEKQQWFKPETLAKIDERRLHPKPQVGNPPPEPPTPQVKKRKQRGEKTPDQKAEEIFDQRYADVPESILGTKNPQKDIFEDQA